jgi:tetratricopeptide (TPR) repeat protein
VRRLAAILATTVLLATAWQGCASLRATRVPESYRKLNFSQRYDIAKYLISIGQLEEAASQLKNLERQAKTDVEKAMANDTKASLHLARRELVSAEEYASRAIRAYPFLASAYRVRALTRKERGNLSGAIQDFKSVLVLEPNDTESLRGLAEIFVGQSKISETVSILERFLQVDSLDARAQDAWCSSMASLLGLDRFPIEYLRTLKSSALSRGELAAVLVVELEMAVLGSPQAGPTGGSAEAHAVQPKASSDFKTGSPDSTSPLNYTELRSKLKAPQLVDIRPSRQAASAASSQHSVDSLKSTPAYSEAPGRRALQASVNVPDCAQFWFAPFVAKAVSLGLLDVYPDGTFRPWDTVRKGILALELYSFLNRHCENALTDLQRNSEEPLRNSEGRIEQNPHLNRALTDYRNLGYSDVDDSSYLWRPVVAVTALDIMRPASPDNFGIDSPLRGEEARAVARNLARVMALSGCEVRD